MTNLFRLFVIILCLLLRPMLCMRYPKSRKAAQHVLEIAARKGAPEAQLALALGILDGRYKALRPTRQVRLLTAQRLLIKAAASNFLPAIEVYADLCEKYGNSRAVPVSYALNELAKEKGGQSANSALLRLKKIWHPSMNLDLQHARHEIST